MVSTKEKVIGEINQQMPLTNNTIRVTLETELINAHPYILIKHETSGAEDKSKLFNTSSLTESVLGIMYFGKRRAEAIVKVLEGDYSRQGIPTDIKK
jgi:hypothetical protein